MIDHDEVGPVAESVDARAMHRSLSWFKSRPGLQPSLAPQASARQASRGDGLPRHSSKSEGGSNAPKCRLMGRLKALSRLRNLV
jgi:hypothetical protein